MKNYPWMEKEFLSIWKQCLKKTFFIMALILLIAGLIGTGLYGFYTLVIGNLLISFLCFIGFLFILSILWALLKYIDRNYILD